MAIIIVDDSKLIRQIIKNNLIDCGIKEGNIKEAIDGREALLVVKNTEKIELIISDLQMPNMDGITFITNLRRTEKTKNTFIVVISSALNEAALQKLKSLNVFDFVKKPFDLDNFDNVVKPLLQKIELISMGAEMTPEKKAAKLRELLSAQVPTIEQNSEVLRLVFDGIYFEAEIDKLVYTGTFFAKAPQG